ncbi:hypothetical protein FHP25_38085 [Vineibacter terrae]|uniref:Uncharacterized protein n=1 Tax=Vineibacter terrae TaxID=2586908 RepID=A0A5C8P7I2_9HYPH|nr:hypothetical protein [Vineibacter terrae]TXL69675.1 hypothetical protein FHP25_38085 [Vineibacter terrae]
MTGREVRRRDPAITRAYHLAETDNWSSIQAHGLLSAQALLQLAGSTQADRDRVTRHRAARTVLSNGIVVRDQGPMPPAALQRCLRGMTPVQWYALLNTKVFFWIDVERLNRHLHACRRHPQIVMVLDAGRLLERHAVRAAVSPFNTGNARRRPAPRGRETFVPYATWLESGWLHETSGLGTSARARSHPPAELTVDRAVPDAMDFVIDVRFPGKGESVDA